VFVYSGIRELLFNVVKHAEVPDAKVDISRSAGEIEITVQDFGRGIDLDQLPRKSGMGLTSLRERAQHFGGQLLIESHPGQGTVVTLALPLPEKDEVSNGDPDSDR
jgi:two-component system sensor histidine kinase UhpB